MNKKHRKVKLPVSWAMFTADLKPMNEGLLRNYFISLLFVIFHLYQADYNDG